MMVYLTIQDDLSKSISRLPLGSYSFVDRRRKDQWEEKKQKRQTPSSDVDQELLGGGCGRKCFSLSGTRKPLISDPTTKCSPEISGSSSPHRSEIKPQGVNKTQRLQALFQQPSAHWKRIEGIPYKLKWQICQATVKSCFYYRKWALLGVENRNSHPQAGLDAERWDGGHHTEMLPNQLTTSTRRTLADLRAGATNLHLMLL